MKKILITCCLISLLGLQSVALPGSAAVRDSVEAAVQFPDAGQFTKSTLDYRIIDSEAGTFGYDIYSDGQRLIHQPTVPGRAGSRGFNTKAGAEKAAQLVIGKIRNGEMPPSVTQEELEKSGALSD